jgi:hypothetical protein
MATDKAIWRTKAELRLIRSGSGIQIGQEVGCHRGQFSS